MRRLTDSDRVQQLMRVLGPEADQEVHLYLTGGATAVLIDRGLVDPKATRRFFDEIEPLLYRYPAIHPPSFRKAVEEVLGQRSA